LFIKNEGLADWAWRQRDQYRLYRAGRPSTLTTTRIAKLTELGFEFIVHDHHGNPVYHDPDAKLYAVTNTEKVRPRRGRTPVAKQRNSKATPKSRFKEGKWLESLAKVVAYKEEHGSCNVPRKWKKDPTLGEWVHFQRRQFRLKQLGRRNHMTDDRIRKLEAIGFEWSRGTPNPPNYMRIYTENKDVYHDPEIKDQQAVAMPTAEHMMELSPMEIMDCREQAQQIADVVEQHVTSEHHAVSGQEHVTSEHHVASGQHHVSAEHQHVSAEHQHVSAEHQHVSAEHQHLVAGQHHVAAGQHHVATEHQHIATEHQHIVAGQHHLVTGQHHHVAGQQHDVVGQQHVTVQTAVSEQHMATDQHHMVSEQHMKAEQHHMVAEQHMEAEQHNMVAEHGVQMHHHVQAPKMENIQEQDIEPLPVGNGDNQDDLVLSV
jgi:hypothetical protein